MRQRQPGRIELRVRLRGRRVKNAHAQLISPTGQVDAITIIGWTHYARTGKIDGLEAFPVIEGVSAEVIEPGMVIAQADGGVNMTPQV